MKNNTKKIKETRNTVQILSSVHDILKNHCDKNDFKIRKFLERLIINNCKEKDQ